jgi:hypothetical protein
MPDEKNLRQYRSGDERVRREQTVDASDTFNDVESSGPMESVQAAWSRWF